MSRLDEARKRRAYREHVRKRDRDYPRAPEWDLEARNKENKQRTKNSTEILFYSADVDKDIAVYERALFDAARRILIAEDSDDPHRLEVFDEPTLEDITWLAEDLFDRSFEKLPEHLKPKQVAPCLDDNGEPVEEEKPEKPAKQKNPLDVPEDQGKQLSLLDEIPPEPRGTNPVLAPQMNTCSMCGAALTHVSEPAFGRTLHSYKCGTVREIIEGGSNILKSCQPDRPAVLETKDGAVAWEPTPTENAFIAAMSERMEKVMDEAINVPFAEFPPDRDIETLAQVAAEFAAGAAEESPKSEPANAAPPEDPAITPNVAAVPSDEIGRRRRQKAEKPTPPPKPPRTRSKPAK